MISRRELLRMGAHLVAASGAIALVGCADDGIGNDATPTRAPAPTPPHTETAATAIVRQIDHILLRTDDASRLFAFLSETLQIPVAWPLFTYRGFSSGAVGFGSVNLEVLQHVEGEAPPFAQAPGTYPIGLAFEPVTVEGAIRELDARGMVHSEPFEDGISDAIRWTSVDLTGPPECPVQLLVKYSFDQDARRAMLGSQLAERGGGPLGVEALAAVEIGVGNVDAAAVRWARLLDPHIALEHMWRPGEWAAIRLLRAESDRFERIVVKVRSLDAATLALNDLRALGESGAGYVDVGFEDGGPSPMRLVEQYT